MGDFSPTRTHATWKPRVTGEHVPFYRCSECGSVFAGLDGNVDIEMRSDGERSLIAELPYAHVDFKPECHGRHEQQLCSGYLERQGFGLQASLVCAENIHRRSN